jgi:hypothetical protein
MYTSARENCSTYADRYGTVLHCVHFARLFQHNSTYELCLRENSTLHAMSSLPNPKSKSKSVKGTVQQDIASIFEVNENSWSYRLLYMNGYRFFKTDQISHQQMTSLSPCLYLYMKQ